MNRLIFALLFMFFSGVASADTDLPKTITENFPAYPKSKIIQVKEIQGYDAAILECEDDVAKVHEFYLGKVKKGGWTIEVNYETDEHRTISAHKSDKACMINIALQNGKTMVSLSIFKK